MSRRLSKPAVDGAKTSECEFVQSLLPRRMSNQRVVLVVTTQDPPGSVLAPSRKVDPMRLILSIAALAVLGLSSAAAAGEKNVPVVPASGSGSTVPVVQVAQSRSTYQASRSSQPGFLDRIMEVERRKNAWLRRTFLR